MNVVPTAPTSSNPAPDIPALERVHLSRRTFFREEWRNKVFNDANGLKATFTECDFSYSVFNRSYFRDAKFNNCQFTGCLFFDCNFRGANFLTCDLKYAYFYRCVLDAGEIIAALPLEANIRRAALQNLRTNATETGDFAAQRLFVLQEISAAKDHYWRAMTGADTYYRNKYSTVLEKALAGWRYAWLGISGFVWGNGERPFMIIVSGTVFLIGLSMINAWSVLDDVPWSETSGGLKILQYTTSLFFDIDPDKRFKGFLSIDYLIGVMRYVYIGLFVSVLYKKISHR